MPVSDAPPVDEFQNPPGRPVRAGMVSVFHPAEFLGTYELRKGQQIGVPYNPLSGSGREDVP